MFRNKLKINDYLHFSVYIYIYIYIHTHTHYMCLVCMHLHTDVRKPYWAYANANADIGLAGRTDARRHAGTENGLKLTPFRNLKTSPKQFNPYLQLITPPVIKVPPQTKKKNIYIYIYICVCVYIYIYINTFLLWIKDLLRRSGRRNMYEMYGNFII